MDDADLAGVDMLVYAADRDAVGRIHWASRTGVHASLASAHRVQP